MPTVEVSEADSGGSVTLRVGDQLVVSLAEGPTTGYRWADRSRESALLALDATELSPGSAIGAAGRRRMLFVARQPGEANIELALQRSWEAGKPPRRTFALRVVVTE